MTLNKVTDTVNETENVQATCKQRKKCQLSSLATLQVPNNVQHTDDYILRR